LALTECLGKLLVAYQHTAARTPEPEALVDADEIGRGVDVHGAARRFQHRAQERDGRALAVGAGDMNHGREPPLRVAEPLQQLKHSIEREIDPLGMEREQPGNDGVDRRHECVSFGSRAHAGAAAGAGSAGESIAAGTLVNTRHSRASVERSSWRGTTRSAMPWSLRYSAR